MIGKKRRLIVLGIVGRTPFAGVAWQALHYLEGFRRLGYEVYYVEDTGDWPYDPEQNTITDDCRYTVNYIARLMSWTGGHPPSPSRRVGSSSRQSPVASLPLLAGSNPTGTSNGTATPISGASTASS